MKASPIRIGMIFGVFLASCHALWAAMVALGWAQTLTDFVFWAHFITPPWHIEPFAVERALILVAFTFSVGLVMGVVGAWLWNQLSAQERA